MEMVLEVLKYVVIIGCGGLALWFKTSTSAKTKASEIQKVVAELATNAVMFITQAEEDYKDTTKAGGEKFEQVVSKLYELVPDGLNKIITRDMISNIVQSTFDEMQKYAKEQLDKLADNVTIKKSTKRKAK